MDWRFYERIESAGIAVLSLYVYFQVLEASIWVFLALVLVPDIGMAGYLKDRQLGATTYNLLHNYFFPAALLGYGALTGDTLVTTVSLIWITHISVDRAIGYGLKTGEGFNHTHLSS